MLQGFNGVAGLGFWGLLVQGLRVCRAWILKVNTQRLHVTFL